MRMIEVHPEDLRTSPDLVRSGSMKSFEERLRSSIEEIGLAEPLKVASQPSGDYIVIDGSLRLRAILDIRKHDPSRFEIIPAYLLDYKLRYEIRFQSDIYQDLLPSQLATLVEHLHATEHVKKADIARYIGVSPATLRNYTGLWRLMRRGGLFDRIVDLMDLNVLPSSNPYAWLRLTDAGLAKVLRDSFSRGEDPDTWIVSTIDSAHSGNTQRYPLKYIELATGSLPSEFYRVDAEVRTVKRNLGLRRAASQPSASRDLKAHQHLSRVINTSHEPVLITAARSLQDYLS